jgi:hypothetical protein
MHIDYLVGFYVYLFASSSVTEALYLPKCH